MLYEDNKPSKVTSVVISTQHSKDLNQEQVKDLILPYIKKSIPDKYIKDLDPERNLYKSNWSIYNWRTRWRYRFNRKKNNCRYLWRSCTSWWRSFSGKDPTKVDRSAAYAARYLSKNIVAAGVSNKCLIQLAYAIGVSKPLSIFVKLPKAMKIK